MNSNKVLKHIWFEGFPGNSFWRAKRAEYADNNNYVQKLNKGDPKWLMPEL